MVLLFLFSTSLESHSQSKAKIAAVIFKTAKKGLGVKSMKQLGFNTIRKKTFTNSFTLFSGDIAKRTKAAKNLTESDILNWLKESGYKSKAAQTNIDKIGLDGLRKICANLVPDAPYNVRKVFIDDFRNNPKLMNEVLDSPTFLKSYTRVVSMGPSFRTNKKFLLEVSNSKDPILIKTLNSQYEDKVLNGVKYVRRVIEIPNSGGLKVSGVFPDFKKFSIYEMPILDKLLISDNKQFNYGFMNFQNVLKRNKELQKQFTPSQLNELLTRKVVSTKSKTSHIVPGYTWHHTESGTLQLVKTDVHDAAKHIGGRELIGGGPSLRYRNVDNLDL